MKVEARNFEIRKHLLEYDDVMNKQRQAFYSLRNEILHQENKKEYILDLADSVLEGFLDEDISDNVDPQEWSSEAMEPKLLQQFGLNKERFGLEWISAAEGEKFASVVNAFIDRVIELGPSPYRKMKEEKLKESPEKAVPA